MKTQTFDLQDVRLLDGPFKAAQDLQAQVMLRYEPDRLLAKFRIEAGLEPRAEHYGGWEGKSISGHSLGHYLSGCALLAASTGDARFEERVRYIVEELAACQDADGSGCVSAIPKGREIFETQIARGDIRSGGFDLNGLWVPFYVWHKLYAGLRDAYRLCGNQQALEVETKMADWLEGILAGLDEDQMQKILIAEHGGMNEVLADLHTDTGDARYLVLSRRFDHKAVLDPLARGIDCLPGLHANTQIPKFLGLAARYLTEGDETDRRTAEFAWDRVVNHHSYVTGGHCLNEHFGPPDALNDRLGEKTTETCNVYNMLKLSKALFQWTARADVADFYERALFNQILATQHPRDGRVIYNLTLAMGGTKHYQDPFGFTCCVGTGMENHGKYGECIYFHGDDALYVNLFIASELQWREKGITLRQDTSFPDADTARFTFSCQAPTELALRLRHPSWAEKGMTLSVNGEALDAAGEPGRYVEIRRTWNTGDSVEVRLPMTRRLESMPDNPDRVAALYGPIVLAGDLGPVDDPDAGKPDYVPALVTDDRTPPTWLTPEEGEFCTFAMQAVGQPRNVTLRPFFRLHERRYTVYWDVLTPQAWVRVREEREAAEQRRLELEARTLDVVQPGQMQPERDHNMQGEDTQPGRAHNRPYRHATGWFAFDTRVDPEKPVTLLATYWGDDGGRAFDVLVDGRKIATQTLDRNAPGQFFEAEYPLPPDITRGKETVTVRFQAHPGNVAGGLFGLRVVVGNTSRACR